MTTIQISIPSEVAERHKRYLQWKRTHLATTTTTTTTAVRKYRRSSRSLSPRNYRHDRHQHQHRHHSRSRSRSRSPYRVRDHDYTFSSSNHDHTFSSSNHDHTFSSSNTKFVHRYYTLEKDQSRCDIPKKTQTYSSLPENIRAAHSIPIPCRLFNSSGGCHRPICWFQHVYTTKTLQ